ncbi:unnamed protein product [Tilletia controversa]|uniref:Protein kinase domain-containing protein n=3 Tax=Tilletia TaxID=13289 RepID=A0A8X7SVY0_9BASI|nr:hypothetical protein CF336_g6447 [Tilletia laevis]KAE8190197.1 hypothetical protein CF328_g6045 [Tilletia controversa]KAE8253452.1 hypothetical protein A4X03_0g5894 [Tilletia caries]KAE8192661.1 hypothetical protein CF335_g5784 [Tilletia laevis]KAE8246124.1 hypothetical protein A4X06_0g5171 [Tilletia controversa]
MFTSNPISIPPTQHIELKDPPKSHFATSMPMHPSSQQTGAVPISDDIDMHDDNGRGGFTMAPSFSSSSLTSSESSLADLSLTSTLSDSSATSYISGDDDSVMMISRPSSSMSDSTRLFKFALDQYSISAGQPSSQSSNSSSHPFVRLADGTIQGPVHRSSYPIPPPPAHKLSSLGLDLGAHGEKSGLQSHRHSIAITAADIQAPSSIAFQRANSACLPGAPLSAMSGNIRTNGGLGIDSRAQAGLQASLNRFKLALPAISMPAESFSSRVATVPLTPGGSFFFGARDGAANGVPMSPFNPPTPLVQSGALTAAYERQLAAEGGILGSAYVAQHQTSPYSPHLQSIQQAQAAEGSGSRSAQQSQQQTGPHRNRLQQKRASLPHTMAPITRSTSGPSRSPLPRPQSRGGPSSSSPRSASPLSTSPSGLETSMSRVAEVSSSTSSQALLQMQNRLAERYSSSRASMLTAASSSSCSSTSSLSAPNMLTPPYSPRNLPDAALSKDGGNLGIDMLNASSGGYSNAVTPRMSVQYPTNSTLHSVDVVVPGRISSSSAPRQGRQQVVSLEGAVPNPHIPEPPASLPLEAIPSPSSLHQQLDVPSLEEIQAIKALSARSVSSTAMVKSASAPPTAAKTVSARYLMNYNLHPQFAATYTLGDELGSGGFGFVVSAQRNADSYPVAVKFIWKEKVPSQGWVRDRDLGVVPMEVFVLKTVRHPSVIRFIELFDDDQFFYLVMELHGTPWKAPPPKPSSTKKDGLSNEALQPSKQANMSGKPTMVQEVPSKALEPPRPAPMERRSSCDLFECIEQHSRLSEEQARWVFAQVVEAVFYLDRLGITHRDIKDENCVVDADFNVKLIDFGSAVVSDPRAPAPYFNRFYGTMTFASAEILQGKLYRAPQAEVWSLGVLLSILLSGECPFSDPTAAIKGRISKPKGMWTSESLELMMRCLDVDANRRATVAELRESPWVRRAWELRGLQRPS